MGYKMRKPFPVSTLLAPALLHQINEKLFQCSYMYMYYRCIILCTFLLKQESGLTQRFQDFLPTLSAVKITPSVERDMTTPTSARLTGLYTLTLERYQAYI